MRNNRWWNIILFIGQILDIFIAAIGNVLDLMGIMGIDDIYFYWITFLVILVILGAIQQLLYWRELRENTAKIVVVKTYPDKQYSDDQKECWSFARVSFSNMPVGNNPGAKSIDTYAEIYYFDDGYSPLLNRTLIGRWGTSKDFPNEEMGIEDFRNLAKVDFEASGMPHDLDIAYMRSCEGMIYGIDNKWFRQRVKKEKEYRVTTKRCFVIVSLHGSRFERQYYFEVFADDQNIIQIETKEWSNKCKKEILKKKKEMKSL